MDSSTSRTGREGGECGSVCASMLQELETSVAGAVQRNRKKGGRAYQGLCDLTLAVVRTESLKNPAAHTHAV